MPGVKRDEWLEVLPESEVERVTEEENERAGVDEGVDPLAASDFLDLESSSASAVRYSAADLPLIEPFDDFFLPNTGGDCIAEGIGVLQADEQSLRPETVVT